MNRFKTNYLLASMLILTFMVTSCTEDDDKSDKQSESFIDQRDNKTYKTIEIGNQIWMAENLNFETANGSSIYDDDPAMAGVYGRLYNWETAQVVCPTGWHLPSDAEWTALSVSLGGESVAGGKMKKEGTTFWDDPNTGASNESGFTALGAGDSTGPNAYSGLGFSASFWSSTEKTSYYAYVRNIFNSTASLDRKDRHKDFLLSVRCVKD